MASVTQEAPRELLKKSYDPPVHSRVVIIGAGMAGLTAAAALSQQFDEVLLLERDNCSNMDVCLRIQPSFPSKLLTASPNDPFDFAWRPSGGAPVGFCASKQMSLGQSSP